MLGYGCDIPVRQDRYSLLVVESHHGSRVRHFLDHRRHRCVVPARTWAYPVISATAQVPAGANVSLVAHLTAAGAPTITPFVNNVSKLSAGQAWLIVRHTAAAPAVDVRAGGTPGDQRSYQPEAAGPQPAGRHGQGGRRARGHQHGRQRAGGRQPEGRHRDDRLRDRGPPSRRRSAWSCRRPPACTPPRPAFRRAPVVWPATVCRCGSLCSRGWVCSRWPVAASGWRPLAVDGRLTVTNRCEGRRR